MGADEKHAATYHGGEYTPSTGQIRSSFTRGIRREVGLAQANRAFDRWIEIVRAEAKAEALNDMAHVLEADIPSTAHESGQIIAGRNIIRIIRARANQYKENQ